MNQRPLSLAVREVLDALTHLMRSEIRLAKTEAMANAKDAGKNLAKAGIFAGIAIVGALCLVAFLILAIGGILGNYWLSALIVGLAFLIPGGLLARRYLRVISARTSLPHTRMNIRYDKELLQERVAHGLAPSREPVRVIQGEEIRRTGS